MPKAMQLRLMIRRVVKELFKICGVRNMILLLLLSLILSYLFSYDKCFDVVMDFLISASVDVSSNMQPTRIDEADLGEWEKRIKELAIRSVKNKIIYLPSVNCHWRLDGIDWYADGYYYKRIKYVLYYDDYFFVRNWRTDYKLALVDITAGGFHKFEITLPCVPGGQVLNYFQHTHFDLYIRSKRLQAALYVAVQLEKSSCQFCVRRIADYSGVLVSLLLIQRFRKDVDGIH